MCHLRHLLDRLCLKELKSLFVTCGYELIEGRGLAVRGSNLQRPLLKPLKDIAEEVEILLVVLQERFDVVHR